MTTRQPDNTQSIKDYVRNLSLTGTGLTLREAKGILTVSQATEETGNPEMLVLYKKDISMIIEALEDVMRV